MIEASSDSGATQVVAPDDGSVIDALRRGDEGAFGRLVDQYQPSLRRVARLYIANRAVADEVVQDTWLGVDRTSITLPANRFSRGCPRTRSSSFIAWPTLAVLSPVGGLRRLARLMRIQDPGLERGLDSVRKPVDA
jgi:hypothetical protein